MDIVFELHGFASAGWFEQLTRNLPETGGVATTDLFEDLPPPGAMGSALSPKFKAHLQTAAQIAAVLSATVTLSHAAFGGSVDQCRLTFSDGATQAEIVVACDEAHSPEFVTKIEGVVAKLREPPSSITVGPVSTPRKTTAPGVGRP